MPIYTYTCAKCGSFEKIVRKVDTETYPCPECGGIAHQTTSQPAPFVWGRGGAYRG